MQFAFLLPYVPSRSTICEAIGSSHQLAQRLPFEAKGREPARNEKMIVYYMNWESLDAKQEET